MTSPLVSTAWLADHMDDPDVRIIEVSVADDATYRAGHIPGAVWANWKELCWHDSDREFLTPREMADRLGRMGIGANDTLVIYGDTVQYGTYAFWALTMSGHRDLRLLDGTRTKWVKEGRPLTRDEPDIRPAPYASGAGDITTRVGREYVREGLGKPVRLLLDVRSPEEYSGERVMARPSFDHGAERNGRIPGAVHLFFRDLVNDDDTYKNPEQLRALLAQVGATPAKSEEIVVYCRLSHRATLAWVAMRYLLGFDNVRIYDGSWTEWGSIVGYPVEK